MSTSDWVEKCRQQLDQMANEIFETMELKRYFETPLTWAGDRIRSAMMRYYFVPNRRDCWAYVQGAAPIDVKQAIWHHEEDELIHDERIGRAHVASERGGREMPEPLPGVRIACYAWIHIARNHPWVEGLAACHILERINDPNVIKGPPLVQRGVNHKIRDLGIKLEDLEAGARVHLEADEEHSQLIWGVFERHVADERSCQQAVRGAKESLECFRVYAGSVGEAMAEARDEKKSGQGMLSTAG